VANVLIAYQNRADESTLSGGTWLASLPRANLQNRLVQKVARSSGLTLAATQFDFDLNSVTKPIGVVALVVHNLSVTAKVRISGNSSASFASPIYQSAWVDVWPAGMVPLSLLEWEADNFWLGTLSESARAGYQSPFLHVLPSPQTLRYWRVEIDDTANPDGYVQIGRLFASATWRPAINYSIGAELGYTDPTPIETSLSGAEYFDVRGRAREFNFSLDGLTESEAYDYVLQLQRIAGVSGEILIAPDLDDATRIPARSYVGRLVDLSPIVNSNVGRFRVTMKLRELI
jgi:hypothetical protein